jgi:hypothetical protein
MVLKQLLENRVIASIVAIYGLFALVLFVCCLPGSEGLPENHPPLEFVLEDVYGERKVSYKKYRGRPVLIYFFASW